MISYYSSDLLFPVCKNDDWYKRVMFASDEVDDDWQNGRTQLQVQLPLLTDSPPYRHN